MHKQIWTFALILILLLFVVTVYPASQLPRMEDVASKLSCYCGTCPHLVVTDCGCSTADQIKADIQKKIDSGMTEDQIIQSYVAEHGETVLSMPTRSGFNLTAWALPFVAFVIGGVFLTRYLKRQQEDDNDNEQPKGPASTEPTSAKTEDDKHYRQLLEKELNQTK